MAGYIWQNTKVINAAAVAASGNTSGVLELTRVDQPFNSSGYGIFPYQIEVAGGSWKLDYQLSNDGVSYAAVASAITAKNEGTYHGTLAIPPALFIKFILTETGGVSAITSATVGIGNKYFTYNI